MKNLTIVEKYSLFVLKNNEKLGSYERRLFIRAAMFFDMLIDENIKIEDKNRVSVTDNVPTSEYYKAIYNDIKSLNAKLKLEDMLEGTVVDIKLGNIQKYLIHKELIVLLKQSMLDKQLITENLKKTVLGEKSELVLNEDCFQTYLNELRTNILENKNLNDKDILLIALLKISNYINNAFSKYEKEILDQKIKELSNCEIYKKANIIVDILINEAATDTVAMLNLI